MQTKRKRNSKYRKSRKNILRGGITSRDTKYATTMIKNTSSPIKPQKPNSYTSVCNEISNQTNKMNLKN